jgi:hypothetical protein
LLGFAFAAEEDRGSPWNYRARSSHPICGTAP